VPEGGEQEIDGSEKEQKGGTTLKLSYFVLTEHKIVYFFVSNSVCVMIKV